MPSKSSPSSLKDFYCDTFDEAFAEVHRRKNTLPSRWIGHGTP